MGPIEVTGENYTNVVAYPNIPVVICVGPKHESSTHKFFMAATALGRSTDDELLVAIVNTDKQEKIARVLGANLKACTVVIVIDGFIADRSTTVTGEKSLKAFVDKTLANARKAEKEAEITTQARKKRHWWNRIRK